MGKVSKVRKHSRRTSGANPLADEAADAEGSAASTAAAASTEGLSRGQRKRLEKKAAFQKRKELVESVGAARIAEKDGAVAAASMLSLSEALAEVNAMHSSGGASAAGATRGGAVAGAMGGQVSKTGKVSSKTRQRIAAKETKQLGAVHAHPAFQANPFAAIQEHLRNMQASTSEERDSKKGPPARRRK